MIFFILATIIYILIAVYGYYINYKKYKSKRKIFIYRIIFDLMILSWFIYYLVDNYDKNINDFGFKLFIGMMFFLLIILYVYLDGKIIDFKIKKQIEKIDGLEKAKNKKVTKQKNHKSKNKQDKKIDSIKLERGFIKK